MCHISDFLGIDTETKKTMYFEGACDTLSIKAAFMTDKVVYKEVAPTRRNIELPVNRLIS